MIVPLKSSITTHLTTSFTISDVTLVAERSVDAIDATSVEAGAFRHQLLVTAKYMDVHDRNNF